MDENQQQSSQEDLSAAVADLVFRLVGSLTEEDLEDPAAAMALEQALDVIEGKPDRLPQDLEEQLAQLKDKAERFRAAAQFAGAFSPELLQRLAASMKAGGLL